MAPLALALHYKDAACEAQHRPSGVRKDQWKTFETLLTKAFEQLNEAQNAEPYDPAVAGLMLTVRMAAGMPKELPRQS